MIELKEISQIFKLRKKDFLKNSYKIIFTTSLKKTITLNLFFLKGASVYRAEFFNWKERIKVTEAKTLNKFYSRVGTILKTNNAKKKKEEQLKLPLEKSWLKWWSKLIREEL